MAVSLFWIAIAGMIVAQATGMTDISPMSGMTLISVALMMVMLTGEITAVMAMAVAVSVAIGMSSDMMQDMKTSFLVGSHPRL